MIHYDNSGWVAALLVVIFILFALIIGANIEPTTVQQPAIDYAQIQKEITTQHRIAARTHSTTLMIFAGTFILLVSVVGYVVGIALKYRPTQNITYNIQQQPQLPVINPQQLLEAKNNPTFQVIEDQNYISITHLPTNQTKFLTLKS